MRYSRRVRRGQNDAFGDRGWLAIALVIFTVWRPATSIPASILFGGLYILNVYIPTGTDLAIKEIYKMAPYVVTIVVLVISSVRSKRENQPPPPPWGFRISGKRDNKPGQKKGRFYASFFLYGSVANTGAEINIRRRTGLFRGLGKQRFSDQFSLLSVPFSSSAAFSHPFLRMLQQITGTASASNIDTTILAVIPADTPELAYKLE